MIWESAQGIVLRDLVPAALRERWVRQGHCPGRDMYSLFAEHEHDDPDRTAVIDAGGSVSYAELGSRARRLAGALRAAGAGPRDIIGVQLPNTRSAIIADLAIAALGAVALPIPADHGARDTAELLRRARAGAAILADPRTLADSRRSLPQLRFVVAPTAEGDEHVEPVDPRSPARILVSSGTEARPKLIAYSHDAMAGGRGNYLRALYGGRGRVRSLVLAPLASAYGSLGIVSIVRHGATLVLLDGFEPAAAARAVARHRPTHMFGVPTMLRRILALPELGDVSSLRTVVASGMPLDAASRAACRDRFGCPVVNVYGSADGVNCHTAAVDSGVGRPDAAVVSIRIGGQGEILARGPMTPLSYVNAPELDARYRSAGGWVRTGDRGRLDADGTLHLVGRLKQIVIRGGLNISLAEAEQQLLSHPAIADATCVAVPDDDLGERLGACVVLHRDAEPFDLAALTDYLESELGVGRRRLPEVLLRLPELPLGPTGKVCRATLTRMAAGLVRSGVPETTPGTRGR